ncbi:MAG: ferrous iron transport protein B, partial [Fibrobacteraceae bacterium]|nr:ferrous iron transport protein B [Fibrobacteraceae bacterium]
MSQNFTIAVAGNPNAGKTALFNALTGSNQVVGNWPGVTVEKKEGFFVLDGKQIRLVDIPGIYALLANSEDERVALDYLLSRDADLIINILDASNLERNLFLTTQLVEMQVPMVLAVNMMDLAYKRGIVLDLEKLSESFGVPVIPLTAVSDKSCSKFVRRLAEVLKQDSPIPKSIVHSESIEQAISSVSELVVPLAKELNIPKRWVAIQYISGFSPIVEKAENLNLTIDKENLSKQLSDEPAFALADSRYSYIRQIISQVVRAELKQGSVTDRLDKIFLNRILALPLFLLVMYLVFWVSVTIGSAFIDFFDILFGAVFVDGLAEFLKAVHAPDFVVAILASGIGAGIQTVATFVPVVFFMFLCLSILEDSGYMARAAFVADRIMRFLGLPGKAFVPMLVGFGCSVPAIMGCRILENKRERFLSIFLVPFMSCGARLPVYALFAAAFFGKSAGLVVFAIYLT